MEPRLPSGLLDRRRPDGRAMLLGMARVAAGWVAVASLALASCGGLDATAGDTGDASPDGADAAVASDAGGASCQIPDRFAATVCAELETGAGDGPLTITGTVVEIARGPWSCSGLQGGFYPERGDQPWRFLVSDGASSAWVGFYLPWRTPLVNVGDTVSIDYDHELGGFAPSTGHLEVRDGQGELLAWMGIAESVAALAAPAELELADGALHCVDNDGCGDFERKRIEVSAVGTHVDLEYYGRADVGPYAVLHLGNEWALPGPVSCTDWFMAHASVLALRGSLADLELRDRPPCGNSITKCAADQYCEVSDLANCETTSPAAACVDAPASCAATCPGVCGCDGKFYCSQCHAHSAGVDVASGDSRCMAAGCEPAAGGAEGESGCLLQWECFGDSYGVECTATGSGASCACSKNGIVASSFSLDQLPDCKSELVATSCGFPAWGSR